MTFIDRAKLKIGELTEKLKDSMRSHDTREADVPSDPQVANSREGKDGEVGRYVGRTFPDTPFDVGQSGAEARSEEKRHRVKREQAQ
ncbi:hypothetical protein [Mycobacterium sp.]|uniref:hypothetical protein n=1 Tax=Mycobacterium sp. TaxID=1785 RepID=UPI00342E3EB6